MSALERPRSISRRDLVKLSTTGAALATAGLVRPGRTLATTLTSAVSAQSGAKAKPGGTLIYATTTDATSLNPYLGGIAGQRILALVYDTLVKMDKDLKIVPALAERWETPDPQTFVFHLRPGIKWHDGKSLTAGDVKFCYEWILSPKSGDSRQGDLAIIDTIEAPDEATVKIHLKSPNGGFLALIADMFIAIVSPDLLQHGDPRQTTNGTGPFRVASWTRDNEMKLVHNTDYYEKDIPYLGELDIKIIPAESSIIAGLRGGTVDQVTLGTNRDALLVKNAPKLQTLEGQSLSMEFVVINSLIKPFDDERVRQALAYAIDHQEILQAALAGFGRLTGPLPPALTNWALPVSSFASYKRDVDKAKALLAAAGLKDGFKTQLTIIPTFPTFVASAQVIAAQLRDIGVEAKIEQVEYAIWLDRLNKTKDMPLTINLTQGVADPDPYLYGRFSSKGFDQPNWHEPDVDALLDQGRAEIDPVKRKAIYDKLQVMLADVKVPYLWLYSSDLIDVSQRYVQGYQQHPTSFLYGMAETWLNK